MALDWIDGNWAARSFHWPRDARARAFFVQVAQGQAIIAHVDDPGALAVMQDAFEHIMRYKCEKEGSLLWCRN